MTASAASAPTRPTYRFPSLQWWIRDRKGNVAVAQLPNPALAVWLATVVIGWTGLLDGDRAVLVRHLGQGALLAWSLDEVARGASPVRRVLGGVVLVGLLVRLFG